MIAKLPMQLQHVVEGVLKSLPSDEHRKKVLDIWANPDVRAINRLVIQEMQKMLLEFSAVEYIQAEEFDKVRIQTVGVSSIFAEMNQRGLKHAEASHELVKAETETPIVTE